ncbi:MAG: MFS transporter [Nevskiaceae bacterium]|nr:MAG: MFS transporter [Nevskiaceae bacterium]TAM33321.1 MAG: MFS transporter [Nevskiaceae bacterium]
MGIAPQAATGLYYGWWLVLAVFVGEMFAIGSTTYAFGLFVKPLEQEFGISRGDANKGLALFIVGMGLSAPLIGRLLDRRSARAVMLFGAAWMATGLVAIALAPSLGWMALATLLVLGSGAAMIGPLTANTLASRWFERRRGRALGVVAVGTSVGGTLLVPLIAYNIEAYGWRQALMLQAGLVLLIVGALALWVVRDRPQDLGLLPDGAAQSPDQAVVPKASPVGPEWTVGRLLRQRDFWCIGLSVGLTFAVTQSVLASLVPYAADAGIDAKKAALLVSSLSVCSILGKLLFGALAERVDKRWLLLAVVAFTLLQLVTLIVQPDFGWLLMVCGLAGFALGGELPVWAAIIAERFGPRSFGTVMGLMNPINMVCSLAAISYVGLAYDRSGGYAQPFTVFLGVALAAGVMTLLIRAPRAPA